MSFRTSQKSFSPILRKARNLFQGSTPDHGFQGHIDTINTHNISGWVKAHEHDAPLEIDLFINGQLIRRKCAANLLRTDLRDAGLGDGRFGFNFASLDVDAGSSNLAEVEIRLAQSGETLLRRAADFTEKSRQNDHGLRVGNFELYIDSASPKLLTGWAVDPRVPGSIFDIDVLIDGTFFCRTRNDCSKPDPEVAGQPGDLGGIRIDLPLEFLEVGSHQVSLVLPDGQIFNKTIDTSQHTARELSYFADVSAQKTAVIVPVFNAPDDLENCIGRLIDHTSVEVEILFIDDASDDPRVGPPLEAAAARPNMRVLRNERNRGFTHTVNRGIEETGAKDVILLNSDARVTPGWIEGMLRAARSGPRIATVTAMSDRAGAFSAPEMGNENMLPPGVDEITFARVFRQHGLGLYPQVPTGNGFCMFVRRTCIDEVGPLDEDAFPRGYGEENDFCMRAGRAGWRHVIDDCTYVFHDRSKSFGAAKTDLMAAGRAVVDARYPEYNKAIDVFRKSPEINLARFRARQALRYCSRPEATLPKALFVISTQSGGTPQTNLDLMAALDDVFDGWLLHCDSRVIELNHVTHGQARLVRRHVLNEKVDPITHHSAEYDFVVKDWISRLDPDLIHIRHIAWHSLSLPEIAKGLGRAVVFSFHDFYSICPTVKLLDDTGTFCGGHCTAPSDSDCATELWPPDSFPRLKNGWVNFWRERFGRILTHCDAFITTSESARETILRHIPDIPADRFHVIPHGRDFDEFVRLRHLPVRGEPLRILIPGHINKAKGLDVIFDLLEHDAAELLEFHVVGSIDMHGRKPHPRLVRHGKYDRADFASMVTKAAPHLGAVFSIWNETYCHTLTELWSVGVPAVVFDFPTVASRVRATGGGWILPHQDIRALYEGILRIAFDPEEQLRADDALHAWQNGPGAGSTTRMMAAEYLDVYRAALRCRGGGAPCPGSASVGEPPVLRVAVAETAEPKLDLTSASTRIRIQGRTRNALNRDMDYIRMKPAALVASLRAGTVDAAILQGAAIPADLARTVLVELRQAGVPYLLDLDDDPLIVRAETDLPDGHSAILHDLMAGARVLTVSTPQLLAACRKLNPDTHLLPDRLNGFLWRGLMPDRMRDGVTRALYLGGRNGQADLRMIHPALDAAAAANPDFRLGLVSDDAEVLPPWAERIEIPPEAKSCEDLIPWLRERMSLFDFALAPMEDASSCVMASPLKPLDYTALGLTVLCSDTPVCRSLAGDAPGARLVRNTTEAWTIELNRRISEGQRERGMGIELRNWALGNHPLEPTLPDFDALVRGMTEVSLRKPGRSP